MPARINRLTARSVAALTKPGRHADGQNLYLKISHGGASSWIFLYRFGGRIREMGLGSAMLISLAQAREKARECRSALATRKAASGATFGQCATDLMASKSSEWRNDVHRGQWRQTTNRIDDTVLNNDKGKNFLRGDKEIDKHVESLVMANYSVFYYLARASVIVLNEPHIFTEDAFIYLRATTENVKNFVDALRNNLSRFGHYA